MVTAIGVPTATAKPSVESPAEGAGRTAETAARGDGIRWPKEQALPRFAAPTRLDVVDIAELH
ncbi:MAG TPA: hypothetical protein VI076_16965, partial [Actinopolymorphaceae bacterium]